MAIDQEQLLYTFMEVEQHANQAIELGRVQVSAETVSVLGGIQFCLVRLSQAAFSMGAPCRFSATPMTGGYEVTAKRM